MRAALIVIVFALALLLTASPGRAAPGPRGAAAIQVAGPRVRLAEIVGSPGDLDGDLGPAPSPGTRRRVYRQQVLALLGGAARDASRPLPPFWQVETRSQILSCAELVRRATAALSAELPAGLRVESLACNRPLQLPAGELQLAAQLLGTARAGRVTVQLSIVAGQWPAQQHLLTASVDGEIDAAVAATGLEVGALPGPGQVRFVRRRASALPADAVLGADDLVGKKLTLRLAAGTVLRHCHLAPVPIVRRGAMVTIAVLLQGMRLTSRGVAREDGARGDTISVLGHSSRLIKARVAEPNYVVVDL